MNKRISTASKFNQTKYGKMLKNQGSEFGKIASVKYSQNLQKLQEI